MNQATKRENAILGHLLFNNKAYFEISDKLKPKFFGDLQNQRICECIIALANAGRSFSSLEINDQYKKKFEGESIALRITELEYEGYSLKGLSSAVDILINDFKVSQMKKMAKAIANNSIPDPVNYAMKFIDGLVNETSETETYHIKDLAFEVASDMREMIEAKRKGEENKKVAYSGISTLDYKLGGFHSGEVITIGAATGMGKSTVARQFAINIGKDHPVFMFTQEMTPKEITGLIGMNLSEIDSMKMRTIDFSDSEFKDYTNGLSKASKLDIQFGLINKLESMKSQIRCWRMKTDKSNPAVLIVDYMQQIEGGKHRKYDDLNEVSKAMKQMAITENLIVLNLAQLSRSVIQRGGDFRPIQRDINGSENIAMDSDIVLLLYRAEYYGFETDDEGNPTNGLLEIDVAKFRKGEPGVVKTQLIKKYGKIEEWNTPAFTETNNNHQDEGVISLPAPSESGELYFTGNPPF